MVKRTVKKIVTARENPSTQIRLVLTYQITASRCKKYLHYFNACFFGSVLLFILIDLCVWYFEPLDISEIQLGLDLKFNDFWMGFFIGDSDTLSLR